MEKIVFILAFLLLGFAQAQNGTDNCLGLQESFGYVDVRPGAHMFWVTYHTELEGDWSDHPLIMWLQGGPGSSSVGYGNFWLLGPCDIYGNPRESRWTQKANLMLVDNPVGAGYSYVDDSSYLTTDNAQIADDLVSILRGAFEVHPEKEGMPFFIYTESYGGKMGIDFALALLQAIDEGTINCNFQGVVLGDSWTSPIDYVNTWGAYLYEMGFVNENEMAQIDASAARTQDAIDAENWVQATNLWAITQSVVLSVTGGIDFYNIHAENSSFYSPAASEVNHPPSDRYSGLSGPISKIIASHLASYDSDPLDIFMNGEQKTKWDIPDNVTWGGQSGEVFNTLNEDFMKPVVDSVSTAIDLYRIHVAVYTGNLDLICDTPGTYLWIKNMEFSGKAEFNGTARVNMNVPEFPNIAWYYQRHETFSLHTFLRAGHMMPLDSPSGALDMIDLITEWGAEASAAYHERKAAELRLAPAHSHVKKILVEKHQDKVQTQPEPQEQKKVVIPVVEVEKEQHIHVQDPELQAPEPQNAPEKEERVSPLQVEKMLELVEASKKLAISEDMTHPEPHPKPVHRVHKYLRGRKVPIKKE